MAIRKEFYYKSRNEKNKVRAVEWTPEDGKVRAVLQISHGMAEHIDRYADFADFMTKQGFVVVGNDHLGHGKTVASDKDFGYFTENNGALIVVRDVHRLKKKTQEKYPGVPYFVLGHSMGSYIIRNYIARYGKGVEGCIILGTGWQNRAELKAGIIFMEICKLISGDRHRNTMATRLTFGKYLSHIENPRTESDWICTDEKVVDEFKKDKLADFIFTTNGFKVLFNLVQGACNDANARKVPTDLPLYLSAGAEDPVGQYGKGVMKTYDMYLEAGIRDLKVKIYPRMRHEILNEIGKETVYQNILDWLEAHMPQK